MSVARSLPRWGVSLLLVLGVHIGVALWSLYWQPQAAPVVLPPPAMLIELPPAPAVAPPAPAVAPAPPKPVRAAEPPPQPKVIEAPKPRLALPPPPKPRPQPPKPRPEPKPEPRQEPKPAAPPQPAQPAATPGAAPASSAPSSATKQAAAQAGSPASSKVKASWQSRLLAHLNRYKRYPDDARRRGQQGVVKLRFVIDGRGQVLSFELASRSGSAALDRATLQMIRRAQPLPAPPTELLKGGRLELVAPFVYSLEER